ncbi:MAG TPA: hypothetical protein VGM01_08750 [Ktedonobacteraceae bacterium]|jgi:hypothetical protein
MILDGTTDRLSIIERMQKIQSRMHLERISGISAENTESFLAFCQVQETSDSTVSAQTKEAPDRKEKSWGSFDKWNDSPVFSLAK